MKRLLILGFIIACLSMLVSCEHTHKKGDFGYDDQHHWYKCKDKDCGEKLEKSEHTWGNGEVTTKPTSGKDGVMTYLCTTCKHIKQESVKYVPGTTVTGEKWVNAFKPSNFNNVTVVIEDSVATNKSVYTVQGNGGVIYMTAVAYKNGEEIGYSAKFQDGGLVWELTSREQTVEDVSVNISSTPMTMERVLADYRLELGELYQSFVHDSETGYYKGENIRAKDSPITYKSISVKMGDGLIYEIIAVTDEVQPQSLVITFSQYGETVPTPPVKK